ISVLYIGFGLGVIDSYFQGHEPANHTIIETHPHCLKFMRENGWYDKPNVRILEGRWQDFIGRFDVVYHDTFQEGYPGHLEIIRCIPRLLSGPKSRFSFFHG
ncbi:hypothetical protein OBBRIDRAFT_715979, partial [Obba rivulosa]